MRSILVLLLCFICLVSAQNSWTTTPGYNADYTPYIKLHRGSPDFTGGDSAYFTCELPTDYSYVSFSFWKEDDLLYTSGTNEFTLHNLREKDNGIYWCSVQTNERRWSSDNSVTITVTGYQSRSTDSHGYHRTTTPMNVRSPTLVLNQPKEYYYEGASLLFICQTNGYEIESKLNFGLKRDGRYVTQQEGREFYLYDITVYAAGRYSCVILTRDRQEVESHNYVYIQIVKSGGVGDGGYGSSGPSRYTFPYTVLIISLTLAMKGSMMGFQA